jgi:hypothetical protein
MGLSSGNANGFSFRSFHLELQNMLAGTQCRKYLMCTIKKHMAGDSD